MPGFGQKTIAPSPDRSFLSTTSLEPTGPAEKRNKGRTDSGVSRIAANDLDLSKILEHGLSLLQEPSQQPASRHSPAKLLIEVAGLQACVGQQILLGHARNHGPERFAW